MGQQRADATLGRALSSLSHTHVRLASGALIAATGLAGVLVPLVHVVWGDIAGPLAGAFVPALFGVVVLGGGYWLANSSLPALPAATVLVWWFLGTAFGTFAALGLVGYQIAAGVSVADPAIVLCGMASIGGVGGLLVGRYDARSQRRRQALRHEREQLADEREKLALLNRIVRHDIGNDLQIIAGMADHLDGHVDTDGRGYLERVQQTTEEAIELTEQVRAFVASLDDDGPSRLRPTSLERVLSTQLENTRDIYREATVSLDGDIPDVAVQADELLPTVFHNLLSNAVEHNDRASPYVEVTVERRADAVAISIADDGPGFPEEERDRLTGGDPAEQTTESGLGLYIVGMLLDRYDGSAAVTDRDPRGSVVTVTLPLSDDS